MDKQNVIFDWKLVVAFGVAPAIVLLASKLDGEAAERVLTYAVNAFSGRAFVSVNNC